LFLQCVGSWSVMDLDWICFYGASFHVPRCGALLSMNLYALRRSLVCLPAMQSACCRGTKICTPDPLIEKLGSGTFFFDLFCMRKWSVPWGTPTDAFLIVPRRKAGLRLGRCSSDPGQASNMTGAAAAMSCGPNTASCLVMNRGARRLGTPPVRWQGGRGRSAVAAACGSAWQGFLNGKAAIR
jgi:hypothetical protein